MKDVSTLGTVCHLFLDGNEVEDISALGGVLTLNLTDTKARCTRELKDARITHEVGKTGICPGELIQRYT
jgi:hypothetical protein